MVTWSFPFLVAQKEKWKSDNLYPEYLFLIACLVNLQQTYMPENVTYKLARNTYNIGKIIKFHSIQFHNFPLLHGNVICEVYLICQFHRIGLWTLLILPMHQFCEYTHDILILWGTKVNKLMSTNHCSSCYIILARFSYFTSFSKFPFTANTLYAEYTTNYVKENIFQRKFLSLTLSPPEPFFGLF